MHGVGQAEKLGKRAGGLGRAWAALVVANLLLALGPWFVRLADVGPVSAAFWRIALAVPFLLLIARWSGGPLPLARLRGPLLLTIAAGGLFFALDLAAWHLGIVRTRLANATLFGNVASFLFAAYGFLIARAWPNRPQGAALLLAAVGTALLLGRSLDLSPEHLLGDALCLGAGLFYTFYLIAIDRARGSLGAWPLLAFSTLASALPLLLLALASGERLLPGDWTAVVLLALGSQVIGQGMMVYAIGHLPASVIGLALLLQPVVAAGIGWWRYDERLGALDLFGIAAIGASLVLIRGGLRAGPKDRT